MFCSNCGHEVTEGAKVCDNCGEFILTPAGESEVNENYNQKNGQAVFHDEELLIINKHNKPLSTLSFFVMQLAFLIPFINIVFLLVWSFRKEINANRKSYARSMLIWFIIFYMALLFVLLTFIFMGYPVSEGAFIRLLKDIVNSIPE